MNMHSDKKIFNKAGSVSKKEGQHGLAVSFKLFEYTVNHLKLYMYHISSYYCIVSTGKSSPNNKRVSRRSCSQSRINIYTHMQALFILKYLIIDCLDKIRAGEANQVNEQTNKRTDEQTRKDHFPMDIPGCNRRCIILEITTAHIYIFRHLSAMNGVGIQRGTSWYNSIIVASNFMRLPHAAWQHQMFPPTSPLDVECRVERTRRSRAFAKEKCDRCDKHHHDYFPL